MYKTLLKFTIYGRMSGLNDYTKACRTNKYAGAQLKHRNEMMAKAAIDGKEIHISERVKIVYNWIEPNKKRDKDNIAFAKKFIQDALVQTGVLDNDGWNNIDGFEDKFSVDSANPRIEVEILAEEEEE